MEDYLESSSTAPVNLNTNGHCFLCLKDEGILSGLPSDPPLGNINPKGITSFGPLLCYLVGASQSEVEGSGGEGYGVNGNNGIGGTRGKEGECVQGILKLTGDHLPPLCLECYDNLAEMNGLHQELVEIQKRIQRKTVQVRECVLRATAVVDEAGYQNCRDKFMQSLGKSGMSLEEISSVSGLILMTHKRIISKGTTPVLFPLSVTTTTTEEEHDMGASYTRKAASPYLMETTSGKRRRCSNSSSSSGDSEVSKSTTHLALALLNNSDTPAPLREIASPTMGVGVNVYCSMVEDQIAKYEMANTSDPEIGDEAVPAVALDITEDDARFKVPLPASSCISLRAPTTSTTNEVGTGEKRKSSRNKAVAEAAGVNPTAGVGDLRSHAAREIEIRHQLCDVCNERIPRGDEGAFHLANHIGTQYVSHCKECEYTFLSPFRLSKFHESRMFLPCKMKPAPIYQCDLCYTEADSVDALRKHLEKHQTDLQLTHQFNCPLCPLTFKSKKMVELHLGDNHVYLAKMTGRQNCDICKSYFTFEEIETHLLTHGVKQPLRCKMCASMFSNLDALIWHQSLAKQNWLHEKVCHLCENLTQFGTLGALRSHYFEAHGLGSKFICETCYDEFLTRENWEQHQLRYHGDREKKEQCASPKPPSAGEDSGVDTCASSAQKDGNDK